MASRKMSIDALAIITQITILAIGSGSGIPVLPKNTDKRSDEEVHLNDGAGHLPSGLLN